MQRSTAAICILAGFLLSLHAAEPERRGTGAPPNLAIVVLVDSRTIEVRRSAMRMFTRTVTRPLPPGVTIESKSGFIGPPTTTEQVPVVETQYERVDATQVIARRMDGQPVSNKDLKEALARPVAVVLAKEGESIDPTYASLFRPDSLLLTLPVPKNIPPTVGD